ncbi:MAG: phosphoribosyl-ATP diphosphatase [Spirochaetota bacterium]
MQPLVIVSGDGTVLDAVLTDEKGFRKSREQGAVWSLNPETGRLLPYEPARTLHSITDEGGWYRAVVETSAGPSGAATDAPDVVSAPGAPSEAVSGPGEPAAAPAGTGTSEAAGAPSEQPDILERLYELVRERRRSMPEGSYTTYLFSSGVEKIRKKTGEEAVELVLARERAEMVSESADLLYHLLVLLCASDIEIREVLDELAGRLGR